MSYKTAWSKSAGSVPSDRLAPRNTPPKQKAANAQRTAGSGRGSPASMPRSKEVLRLESLRDGLQALVSSGRKPGKDPKGGCFCQARSHALSTYNPACAQCGLPLCMLNLPHYACPSCRSPLLSGTALNALLTQIEDELHETLRKEEDERRRIVDERKRVEGGFPTLSAAASSSSTSLVSQAGITTPAQPQAHKVLSLNSKTKRATVSTYTKKPKATPPSSGPASRADSPTEWDEGLPRRVPPPPAEVLVPNIPAQKLKDRPWFNAREDVSYVGPARL